MQAQTIDAELSRYWMRISESQKLVVLDVLKNFVAANQVDDNVTGNQEGSPEFRLSDAEWEDIQKQREEIANSSMKTYSWEEVKSRISQKYGPRKI